MRGEIPCPFYLHPQINMRGGKKKQQQKTPTQQKDAFAGRAWQEAPVHAAGARARPHRRLGKRPAKFFALATQPRRNVPPGRLCGSAARPSAAPAPARCPDRPGHVPPPQLGIRGAKNFPRPRERAAANSLDTRVNTMSCSFFFL